MNWRRVRAIARKDLREVTASKSVTVPMAVVPLILCVALPAVLLLVALEGGADALGNVGALAKLVERYPIPTAIAGPVDRLLYVVLNYSFLPFFMIIPLLVSSVVAANAVVGEKERGTLETLLYTPVTNEELVVAKLASSFLPAVAATLGSFVGYFLVSNGLYLAYRGALIVRAAVWIPGLLLLAPSVALLGLAASLLVSIRAKTFLEAQQMSGIVVVPFVAILYGQIGGLFVLGPVLVVALAVVVLALSYLLYRRIAPRLNREQILAGL